MTSQGTTDQGMSVVLIELVCHSDDEEMLIAAVRAADIEAPIDVQHLDVYPLDLSGGSIRERITGRLPRRLLRVVVKLDHGNALLERLADIHLQHSVRWSRAGIDDTGEIS